MLICYDNYNDGILPGPKNDFENMKTFLISDETMFPKENIIEHYNSDPTKVIKDLNFLR